MENIERRNFNIGEQGAKEAEGSGEVEVAESVEVTKVVEKQSVDNQEGKVEGKKEEEKKLDKVRAEIAEIKGDCREDGRLEKKEYPEHIRKLGDEVMGEIEEIGRKEKEEDSSLIEGTRTLFRNIWRESADYFSGRTEARRRMFKEQYARYVIDEPIADFPETIIIMRKITEGNIKLSKEEFWDVKDYIYDVEHEKERREHPERFDENGGLLSLKEQGFSKASFFSRGILGPKKDYKDNKVENQK